MAFYYYKNVISNSIAKATLRLVMKAVLKSFHFTLHWLNLFSRVNTISAEQNWLFFFSEKYYLWEEKINIRPICSRFHFHLLNACYFSSQNHNNHTVQTYIMYVYSHILDRSHLKAHYIPSMHCNPHIKVELAT